MDWHENKLCSNMTQKRGKRASASEKVEYEFRLRCPYPAGTTAGLVMAQRPVEGDAKRHGYSYSRGALSNGPSSRGPIIV